MLDALMEIILIVLLKHGFTQIENKLLKQLVCAIGIGMAVIIFIDFIRGIKKASLLHQLPEGKKNIPHRICLLNERGIPIKEWELDKKNGFLIGIGSIENDVDIDLRKAEYAAFIKDEHAVLNFVRDTWYIESLDDEIGVELLQRLGGDTYHLKSGHPLMIMPGDRLRLAKTILEVW